MKTIAKAVALVALCAVPCNAQCVFKVRRAATAVTMPADAMPIESMFMAQSSGQMESRRAPSPSGRWYWSNPTRSVWQCGPNGCRIVPQR